MIDLRKLKELVALMAANDLTELDIQGKDDRVTIKRGGATPQVTYAPGPGLAATGPNVGVIPGAVPAAAGQPPVAADAGTPAPAGPDDDDGLVKITSPMVGTFYAAPSPDAQPFIAVGDAVKEESVVCIVEAMKVFNEIKAEVSGKVEKVLAETGQAVEYGQPLFLIRPG